MLSTIYSLIFLLLSATCAHAGPSLLDQMQKLEKSLVGIKTVYTRTMTTPKGKKRVTYTRQGTGIIIDPKGWIITNTHIVKNAPRINVILHDGRIFFAQVLFVSVDHDFSILRINGAGPLAPVKFADSATAQVGESIMAIGSSDYNDHSILSGNITGLIQSQSSGTIEFIETNLSLYQGDSGGPIFNRQGKLLGMVMGKHQSKAHSSLCIASDRMHEQYLRTLSNINRQ